MRPSLKIAGKAWLKSQLHTHLLRKNEIAKHESITIINTGGDVAYKSPGAIQAQTILHPHNSSVDEPQQRPQCRKFVSITP